ncbi:MAG: RNA polymerase sigma factor [Phycisphaerae bacterium]|nr:RNA polymerase sigma factor [Saprospiraceae bacterium]
MSIFRPNYTDYTDEALMQAIAQRNERAFAVLYERYSPRMYRFFFRMFWKNASKAEDFTQEIFLKIIEKPHLFDTERNFRTWIYTLAYNLCKNEYRRPPPLEITWDEPNLWDDPMPEKMDKERFEAHLRHSIATLSETHRQCFILRYQEELSVLEIAEIVGCPEGTVKSRLHHALRQVAGQMEVWKHEKY